MSDEELSKMSDEELLRRFRDRLARIEVLEQKKREIAQKRDALLVRISDALDGPVLKPEVKEAEDGQASFAGR